MPIHYAEVAIPDAEILTVYLKLLDRPVPATYGPTADVTWADSDPT